MGFFAVSGTKYYSVYFYSKTHEELSVTCVVSSGMTAANLKKKLEKKYFNVSVGCVRETTLEFYEKYKHISIEVCLDILRDKEKKASKKKRGYRFFMKKEVS